MRTRGVSDEWCSHLFGRLGTTNANYSGVLVRKNRFAVIAISMALVLTGCSKGANTAGPSASPSLTKPALPIWPMTGISSKNASQTKPVLVIKVENDPGVRPQSGLDSADIVFEELVEGGITRFCTIFQSKLPKEVGPVRSVRHVDASIAAPVADYFVFSGGARPTLNYLRGNLPKGVKILTEGAPGMHRTNYHYAPHNLFLNPQTLVAQSSHTNSPTKGIFARPISTDWSMPTITATPKPTDAPSASPSVKPAIAIYTPASGARVVFSNGETPNWTWSAKRHEWVRFEGSTPHTSKDGRQLGFTNLVALHVQTVDAGYRDPAGNFVPRTVFTGTGKGTVMMDGKAISVTWSKPELASLVQLKDVTGKVVALNPGRTWVELVPNTGSFTVVKAKTPAPKPSSSK